MKKLINKLLPTESRPERVGPRITAMREALGLKKSELADTIDLDRSTLSKIENGTVGLDIAKGEAIAAIYGFGLDFIYRRELADVPEKYRDQLLLQLATYQPT